MGICGKHTFTDLVNERKLVWIFSYIYSTYLLVYYFICFFFNFEISIFFLLSTFLSRSHFLVIYLLKVDTIAVDGIFTDCVFFWLHFIFTRWNRINASNSKQTTIVNCTQYSIFINNNAKSYIQYVHISLHIFCTETARNRESVCVCIFKTICSIWLEKGEWLVNCTVFIL